MTDAGEPRMLLSFVVGFHDSPVMKYGEFSEQ